VVSFASSSGQAASLRHSRATAIVGGLVLRRPARVPRSPALPVRADGSPSRRREERLSRPGLVPGLDRRDDGVPDHASSGRFGAVQQEPVEAVTRDLPPTLGAEASGMSLATPAHGGAAGRKKGGALEGLELFGAREDGPGARRQGLGERVHAPPAGHDDHVVTPPRQQRAGGRARRTAAHDHDLAPGGEVHGRSLPGGREGGRKESALGRTLEGGRTAGQGRGLRSVRSIIHP
jgi:hypothetical protein